MMFSQFSCVAHGLAVVTKELGVGDGARAESLYCVTLAVSPLSRQAPWEAWAGVFVHCLAWAAPERPGWPPRLRLADFFFYYPPAVEGAPLKFFLEAPPADAPTKMWG